MNFRLAFLGMAIPVLLLAVPQGLQAQSASALQQLTQGLTNALQNGDPYTIANAYEQLGQYALKSGDYPNAELWLSKAEAGYRKLDKGEDLARCLRALAESQEKQSKKQEALLNYRQSGNSLPRQPENLSQSLSINDMQRLQYDGYLDSQEVFSRNNIKLIKNSGSKVELSKNYGQLAEINVRQNNIPDAVKHLQSAIENADDAGEAVKYTQKLSEVLSESGHTNDAIAVQEKMLQRPDIQQDIPGKIALVQHLAKTYARNENDADKSLQLYRESYEDALRENRIADAKQSLEGMVTLLQTTGELASCLSLYAGFLHRLDSMLLNDPTLIHTKIIEETKGRVKALELEKAFQEERMERARRFSYILIGAVLLFLLLSVGIAVALRAIQQKNKKIALQSLRREMNPHFIFNSLNSINQFIARNDEAAANKYLSAYARLMRSMMEHSNKDFVTLTEELITLEQYLDLEKQRFPETFDYQINIEENLDPDAVAVPNMIIQPFLENAIWHGLRYKSEKGLLSIGIEKSAQNISIRIEDNGIGLQQSQALKTKNQKTHVSRGMRNTEERVLLLNKLYHKQIVVTISDKPAPETGVLVVITYHV